MSKKDKKNARLNSPVLPEDAPRFRYPFWLIGLAALWAFGVLIAFYNYLPFSLLTIPSAVIPNSLKEILPTFPALISHTRMVLWVLLINLGAIGLGRWILKKWVPDSDLLSYSISYGVGLGVLGYVSLAMAWMGWYQTFLIKAVLIFVAGTAVVNFLFLDERKGLIASWAQLKLTCSRKENGALMGILLVFFLFGNFFMAFIPELFYDALVYHLGVPHYYLIEGRMAPIDLMTAKFPFTVQMIYGLGLAVGDERVTKLLHLSFLIGTILASIGWGRKINRPRIGLMGGFLFAILPTVQINVATSGVDLGVTLFGFLSLVCFWAYCEKEATDRKWLLLSAVLSGFAIGSKYTAVSIPITIVTVGLILAYINKINIKKIILDLFLFGGVVTIVFFPWMLKNILETGNPVFPFLSKIFGGLQLEEFRYETLRYENRGIILKSLWDWVTIYWKLSITERSSLSFHGPLQLALGGFAILGWLRYRNKESQLLLIFVGIYLPLVLIMTRLTRYWMPGLPFISFVIAYGLDSFARPSSMGRRFLVTFVICVGYAFQVTWGYMIAGIALSPKNVILGRETRESFQARFFPGWNPNPSNQMYHYIEKNLSADTKVLLVGEEKAFPLKHPHIYSGVYDHGPLVRYAESSASAEEMYSKFKEIGITHFMINTQEAYRLAGYGIFHFSPEGFGRFCEFWEKHVQFDHLERVAGPQGTQNPIVLISLVDEGKLTQGPLENVLVPIYEQFVWPRFEIVTPKEKVNFYRRLLENHPNVQIFRQRLQIWSKAVENN